MVLIQVSNNIDLFIKKCIKLNLQLIDIKYINENIITAKVCFNDLDNIKKTNYYSNIEIVRFYGLRGVLKNIQKYFYDYLLLIVFIVSLYFISNFIVIVDVITTDNELSNHVIKLLNDYDIKSFSYVKSNKELVNISNEIIKNETSIEWISISRNGMKYIVNVEKRVKKELQEKYDYCDIVASKDSKIISIDAESGVKMVEAGESVKKGDVLVSGDVILNDEVKNRVCAKATVIGEVWYKVNMSVPIKKTLVKETGKSRINFKYNNNYLYKQHYNNYKEKNIFKINIFGNVLNIIKEYEIIDYSYKMNKDEIIDYAISTAVLKINEKNNANNIILFKNVLKYNEFNSKIDIELFIVMQEEIDILTRRLVGDISDTNKGL